MSEEHLSKRLNGLSRGPGPLDALLTAGWNLYCKFKGKSPTASFEEAAHAAPHLSLMPTPPSLPPYVSFVDADVVSVHIIKKVLIDGFCQHNAIQAVDLYLPVLTPNYVAVKRDVLDELLRMAADAFTQNACGTPQASFAQDLLSDFDFLSAFTGEKSTTQAPAAYKVAAAWERHNQ